MGSMLIGTKNPHKQRKLAAMVSEFFQAAVDATLPDVEEHGDSFEEIARNKAAEYSRLNGGYAISTDGGAVIPALRGKWNPLRTRRFAGTDQERIASLLKMLEGSENRTVEWHEAVAVAHDGNVLFSTTSRAMDGFIVKEFDSQKYREGIWLCSLTAFPQFGGRNYFDLTREEQEKTEDSWSVLGAAVRKFFASITSGT